MGAIRERQRDRFQLVWVSQRRRCAHTGRVTLVVVFVFEVGRPRKMIVEINNGVCTVIEQPLTRVTLLVASPLLWLRSFSFISPWVS